jgi:5-formyltetrahydrofolate cyclo-ligase
MPSRLVLRQRSRSVRSALTQAQRHAASREIARHLRASPLYWSARHIALFWPVGPEVDLREFLHDALAHGKHCYLPLMRPGRRMWFLRYRPGMKLVRNSHGIPEPRLVPRDTLAPQLLDLVCVPLLGFDVRGNRLGQGGGYYDRTFSFKREAPASKPRLLGVAFACQQLEELPRAAWDVPLGAVVTERGIIDCSAATQRKNSA